MASHPGHEDAEKDGDAAMPIQIAGRPVVADCGVSKNAQVKERISLTSLEGKPYTIICMTHGRLCFVFQAP